MAIYLASTSYGYSVYHVVDSKGQKIAEVSTHGKPRKNIFNEPEKRTHCDLALYVGNKLIEVCLDRQETANFLKQARS
jgi:hypothetical protein